MDCRWRLRGCFCWLIVGTILTAIAPQLRAETETVELVRDQWGVPHIFADTDAGAMYGLGYATAEDRGFQMNYMLRIMQGRLAEVIGDVKKTRRNETAVDNDRKMRTFGFYRAAEELVPKLDAETRGLLQAYSDGVNAHFTENIDKLHSVYEKVGLEVEPWKPADCLVSWWHLAQFFATDGTRDLMHWRNLVQGDSRERRARMLSQARGGRSPARGSGRGTPPTRGAVRPENLTPLGPDEAASVIGRDDVAAEWIERTQTFLTKHGYGKDGAPEGKQREATPKFSHAWVADGKTTGTGGAILVSKPQTPVTNPSLLYEFHIKGKTIDARGCGVAGSPVILIGWNRHVAWGMTALGADQADLFRLKTDAEHPDQYEFDGQWLPIRSTEQEIKVKGSSPQKLTIRTSHFGPIINEFAFSRPGDPPVASKRVPICEQDRETVQGALAMMRAGTVNEFFEALASWRFPTANVVFGDSQGNIGYSTAGALVLRSPLALEAGGAAHDGSASRYDWRAVVPQQLVPHVFNPNAGYLFSGNHRPIGSFYTIPLGNRTFAMGDSLRSWRLRQMFAEYKKFGPRDLLRMETDPVNPARREIVRIGYHLRDGLKRELSPETTRALKYLESWYAAGAPSRLDVEGAALAQQINTMFRLVTSELTSVYGGGESGLSRFLKTVGKQLDEDPRAPIGPQEEEFVDNVLATAWEKCQRQYGGDPSQWNVRAREEVTARRIGYFESLDGFPSVAREFDMANPDLTCVDGATIFSQGAEAYVQWVPLAFVDKARSILPPGQSEVPDDPMRTVNVPDWVDGKLHPAPLSREAVEKHAVKRQTLTCSLPQ